jgi:hypothetical protein
MAQAHSIDLERAADVLCHSMHASDFIRFEPPGARDDYDDVNPQQRLMRKMRRYLEIQASVFSEMHPELSEEAKTLLRNNTTMRRGVLVEHIKELVKSKTPEELTDRAYELASVCSELGWCPVLANFIERIEPCEFMKEYFYIAKPKNTDDVQNWLKNVCETIQDVLDDTLPFEGSSILYVSNEHMYEGGELDAIDDEMPDLENDMDGSKEQAPKRSFSRAFEGEEDE